MVQVFLQIGIFNFSKAANLKTNFFISEPNGISDYILIPKPAGTELPEGGRSGRGSVF